MALTDAIDVGELRHLLDRQAIADCITRISRGADRFDRDLYLTGFHEGARISTGASFSTPAESYERGRAMHDANTSATLHVLGNQSIDAVGDDSHVETYYTYLAQNRDGSSWMAAGRYLDQLPRRDGRWGIVLRHIAMEGSGGLTPHQVAMFAGAPLDPRLITTRDRHDASYLRPLRD